jgi:signal recognition particle subunit SRP54
MVLDSLGESLRRILNKVASAPTVDPKLVKEIAKEMQRALLQGDVNVKLVLELTKRIEEKATKEKPPAGMSAREYFIKIIHDELLSILGKGRTLKLGGKMKILLVGLYGQGKTTSAGKLSRYFQRRGMNPALIAGDVHRPAAYDQLKQIGEKISVPVFGDPKETKAAKLVREGIERFKQYDVIIVDTAGRDRLDEELIEEVKRIATVAEPNEVFLVLDATMGQQAGIHAKAFHDAVGLTGVILTKLDGSAKGGGALSAVGETGAQIAFVGVGEHLDDLELFDPTRFISRLLGWGDLKSLLERAEEVVTQEDAERIAHRLMSGKFTLKDMYNQMEAVTKMGPLSKLMSMLPTGMFGTTLDQSQIEGHQKRLRKWKVIMQSMTKEELNDPKIIKSKRISRIARGSGTTEDDVRELIKQYNVSVKALKNITSNREFRRRMERQMKGMGGDLGTGG